MRAKFKCPMGVTNVWTVSQLRGSERLKNSTKAIHLNQKPLEIIKKTIEMCSDKGDVVWDPFAGLATTAIASLELERRCFCSEINEEIYEVASKRISSALDKRNQSLF